MKLSLRDAAISLVQGLASFEESPLGSCVPGDCRRVFNRRPGLALWVLRITLASVFSLAVPLRAAGRANEPAVVIQHPFLGAVMPHNMPSPAVLWKFPKLETYVWAARWNAGSNTWQFENVRPMWRPPEGAWLEIKTAASTGDIELILIGRPADRSASVTAQASVRFSIAPESVTDSLFYRDVNLPFLEAVKDPSKIRWRFGTIDTGVLPPVVLQNMIVCGNCHSFSRDGKYLAMDIDYANDKGSYVMTRTAPEMQLATSDIITWGDFRREDGQETLGLLSQISPDGRYVLSTVKDLSVFMPKPDLAFSQLFFPFMGIIGVYDRETKSFSSLPGADDPAFVQSNATWSPDGKWVVFARNRAVLLKGARQKGRVMLSREDNDELFRATAEYKYDLYRVPFNGGKGGKSEPLLGASKNGRSNFFPKYSPDGRWIVYCQASNYMLLQRDSEMFIIPSEGGEAKRLRCNLTRMNSWHSWSLDGRWLVFTSKEHSDYTQLYLTRINMQGEASPPVWLAHMVEPERVANIPEFVALPARGIARIQERFVDDVSYVRAGNEFLRAREVGNAIVKYRAAVDLNPNNALARQRLGMLLLQQTNKTEGIQQLQAAVQLDPRDPMVRYALACTLAGRGELSNAVVHLEEGLKWLPNASEQQAGLFDPVRRLPELMHVKLALAYNQAGNLPAAERHYRDALGLASDYPEAHQNLGTLLLRSGRMEEAETHFKAAIQFMPRLAESHNCLGVIRLRQNRRAEALACFSKAVECDGKDWQARLNLGLTLLADDQREAAHEQFAEVLRLHPTCETARKGLDELLSRGSH